MRKCETQYSYRNTGDGPYCCVTRDWDRQSRPMRATDPNDTRPGAHWDTSQTHRKLKALFEQRIDEVPPDAQEFGGSLPISNEDGKDWGEKGK